MLATEQVTAVVTLGHGVVDDANKRCQTFVIGTVVYILALNK